jgi:hypothetical protein
MIASMEGTYCWMHITLALKHDVKLRKCLAAVYSIPAGCTPET